MAKDSTTTPLEAAAPAEADQPEAGEQDTGANTQQSQQPNDWEARFRAYQASTTAKLQRLAELEDRLSSYEATEAEEPDDEDEEPAPRTRRAPRSSEREAELAARLEEAEWTIARAIYPDEVIDAYSVFADLFERAQTAADYVGAAEAYHLARSRGATPQQAAAAAEPPPPAAVMPRSDSNRSDAPVLPEIENQLREAAGKRDLTGWAGAMLRRLEG